MGFSTGCLYKTHNGLERSTIEIFRNVGCNAIEIMWHEADETEKLLDLDVELLKQFEYVSIHAPSFGIYNDVQIVAMLQVLAQAHEKINFKAVVLHPYANINWDVFRQFDLPFMIENMDWRKEVGKYTESLEEIFSKFDAPMVLDVNHCMTNDPSMHLAQELSEKFTDRIKEIHASGFETFHECLYKTQQQEILSAIPDKNLPIIIESGCETIEDVEKEFAYLKQYLQS